MSQLNEREVTTALDSKQLLKVVYFKVSNMKYDKNILGFISFIRMSWLIERDIRERY